MAVYGGKELLLKLLGPTAEYLRHGVKTLTEAGIKDLRRIFSVAWRGLGSRLDSSGRTGRQILQRDAEGNRRRYNGMRGFT